ncbi:small, acid-soluble spore protein, H family [Peribacillus saganii]|uniref:Small, acid-soluble spore protein, H family n=1 Tax=Peribacillus saganii TaxID=2303992 RepID=A0A372LF25_9BACI|nr:H-type small acid-soluble spore protein [Peribacillus saganii]RFU64501.1 small, acid-soluble spore protein, H family [Peribacillus saganii]
MDLNRIKEIIGSEDDIAVHYHGVPVWIEGIDDTGSLATVSARGTHDHRRVVAIDALTED